MLNPFPELLAYGFLLGPVPLRLVAGIFLITIALSHLRQVFNGSRPFIRRTYFISLGSIELVVGAFIFAGFQTQIAALGGILLSLLLIHLKRTLPSNASHSIWSYAFLGALCLSLLFLGAGGLGFDIPL